MQPNVGVYGAPSTWTVATTSYIPESPTPAPEFKQNMIAQWATLGGGITAGNITPNVELDTSICYAAIAADAPIAAVVPFNAEENEEGAEVLPDKTNFFFGYVDTLSEITELGYYYDNSSELDKRVWMPVTELDATNANRFINPYVSIAPNDFVLLVCVEADDANYSNTVNVALSVYEGTYANSHPNISRVYVVPHYLEDDDPIARTSFRFNHYSQYVHNNSIMVGRFIEMSIGEWVNVTNYADGATRVEGDPPTPQITLWGMPYSGGIYKAASYNGIHYGTGGEYHTNGANYTKYYRTYDREFCLRCAASLGLFFTDKPSVATGGALNDPDMYLGIIDANGLTHGDYTRGEDNESQPQYEWESTNDSDYDPSSPITPTPSVDPIYPSIPGLTITGKGSGAWALTKFDVDEVMHDIFYEQSGKLTEGLKIFGNEAMNAVLSFRWYPMIWDAPTSSPIVMGAVTVNPANTYTIINDAAHSMYVNNGKINIRANYPKNFYNARYTQARLWLPFYGFYEVPMPQLMSCEMEVSLHYNLPDDLAVWIISFDNVIYDFVECAMGIDIPLTGANTAQIAETKRNAALSIATSIAGIATSVITGGIALGIGQISGAGIGAGISNALIRSGTMTEGLANSYGFSAGNAVKNYSAFGAATGMTKGVVGGVANIVNTVHQAKLDIAALKVNVPYHGAASPTTFLNFPMRPYLQVFKNDIMAGYSEVGYKLKVGHACDIWGTLSSMPANSLCQATGIADMSTSGMTLAEVQELNSLLQEGVYRLIGVEPQG